MNENSETGFDILAPQKEQVISEVIKAQEVDLSDHDFIREHFNLKLYPDGKQVFCFLDKPLVEFYPVEVEQVREDDRVKMVISQKYKVISSQ